MSAAAATPKKTKPRSKPSHPSTVDMIKHAIKELKERNGSSLQAIKKYIAAHYKVDIVKLSPYMKKALKSGVEKGIFTQTKGKGASGSFKLAVSSKSKDDNPKKAAAKKPAAKKAAVKKSPKKVVKKAVAKKAVTPKKAPAKKAKTPKRSPVKKVAKKPAAKKPAAKKTPKKAAKKA